jgi:ABC-2 type transport system permease protein
MTLIQVVVIFSASALLLPLAGFGRLSLTNPGALIVISIVTALCSTSLGLLIAAIARTENQIGTFGSVVLWLMGAVSGAFIPRFILGNFLGTVGKVIPHYWAISAYQDVLVRGQGFDGIGNELAVLAAFTLLFFGLGIWRFRFTGGRS